jgi:predicted lipid-binding transport protein (Tim44 family)
LAGGLIGGMLGGMLFRGLFGGGWGGGFGLLDILLVLGIGYMIFRLLRSRGQRTAQDYQESQQPQYESREKVTELYPAGTDERVTGIGYIRQMDPSFDEERFKDQVMDIFFKVQSAWMNRDLGPVTGLLTDEVRRIFQDDIDRMLRDRQVNRLENIAVRSVELNEVWQEAGQDYITALVYANLLDYTVDDASGQVISGSKTEPVKFEEFWTFTRPVGNNQWRLSAIHQAS